MDLIRRKAISLASEINDNTYRIGQDWGVWSGGFNRNLRNLISCTQKDRQSTLRLVFLYWRGHNELKSTSGWSIKKKSDLVKNINKIYGEINNEKK